jgi:hypothetical protein
MIQLVASPLQAGASWQHGPADWLNRHFPYFCPVRQYSSYPMFDTIADNAN